MYFFNPRFVLYLSLFLIFIQCSHKRDDLQLAAIFNDHMVLQQQAEVPIWGTASPGDQVSVKTDWGTEQTTKVAASGEWILRIKTPEFGGPYNVTVNTATQQLEYKDVMIGEVWLASGQSNMEWPMSARILNQKKEVQNVKNNNIRMFSVPRNLNGTNINSASWKVATPENAPGFSAVGYFFARELNQELKVPIGILNTSWGGTRVEAWTSFEKLLQMPESSGNAKKLAAFGSLNEIKERKKAETLQIEKANRVYLNAETISIPESIPAWEALDLGDFEYVAPQYDDTSWSTVNLVDVKQDYSFSFEDLFGEGIHAENGVIWLRKTFDLKQPQKAYQFIAENGIDDYDYTYLNGQHLGTGLSCCTQRTYDIPQGLLKEKGNVLAIRVLDRGGKGGFRGATYLKTAEKRFPLDTGIWKFKHIAFDLSTSIQKHNLSFEVLTQQDSLLKSKVKKGLSSQDPNIYSVLFRTMIEPVLPYGIKGFLWYQGESNVGKPHEYQNLFTGMIEDWREKWGAKLPFYFVQIAPYQYTKGDESQKLRDAQRKTLGIEKTAMAITLDIGEEKDIHPANKQEVGKRLARHALYNDYDRSDIIASGPLYSEHKTNKNYLDVYFDYVGLGLVAKGVLSGFEISGLDGEFYPAQARIIKDKVRLRSKKVPNPKHARYGWKNYFDAQLFNKEGLPASSFSTN
jgi:sialate O-acetylesterase